MDLFLPRGSIFRLISRDNVSLLNKVRTKAVHFAWDNLDEDLTEWLPPLS